MSSKKRGKSSVPSKKTNNHSIISHQKFSYYQGSFPSPEMLEHYEVTVPGSAKLLFELFEQQTKHRIALEKSVISSDIKDSKLGLWMGFVVAMTVIISGGLCILNGYAISGTILSTGALSSLVGVFVYGSRQRRKERENKYSHQ